MAKAIEQSPEVKASIERANIVSRFSRDEHGLLNNINYVFNDDSTVNWKAMIPKQYLVVNKEYFESRGIDIPASTDGLDDKQLLVLLGGFKEVAKLRGLRSVQSKIVSSSESHASVECTICFIDNYEMKGGMPCVYTEVANATLNNTNSFASNFLETIASNRAFVRAVRNALRIEIVGSDEISSAPSAKSSSNDRVSTEAWAALKQKAANYVSDKAPNGYKTFEEFKAALVQREYPGASEWTDWESIPQSKAFDLLSKLTPKAKS